MRIDTKFMGEMEISEENIIHFEKGIPAFEEEKKFVIIPMGEDTPFLLLQSIQTVEVAFIIVSPFPFFLNYEVKLTDAVISELDIQEEKDVAIYNILTVKDPFVETTINLQAPIIINTKNKKGKQFVIVDGNYETRQKFIQQTPSKQEEVR